MKKSLYLLFSLCVIFSACKDDDVVSNRVIFKFSLKDPIYDMGDRWIVLHDDESGEVIDSRLITKGEVAIFESTKKIAGDKMTVTYFRASDRGGSWAQVFAGVGVGSEWTSMDEGRNQSGSDSHGVSGTYSLTINNAPTLYSFTIADKTGTTLPNVKAVNDNGTIILSPRFNTGLKQLVSIDPLDGKQKYAFIENIGQDENVVLDYNDFKEFDKYIEIDFPSYSYIDVKAYPGLSKFYNTYDLYYNNEYGLWDNLEKQELNLGVLNEFPLYRITTYSGIVDYSYLGPAPSKIDYPNFGEFVVTDTGIDTYKIEAGSNFNHRHVNYRYNPPSGSSDRSIQIEYYGPQDSKLHDALSDEIIAKYSLKMDKLEYGRSDVTFGTQTYPKLLDYYFADVYDPSEPFEITTISVREEN